MRQYALFVVTPTGPCLHVFRDRVPKMSPTTGAPQIKKTVREHGKNKVQRRTLKVPWTTNFSRELWEHAMWILDLVCPFLGQLKKVSAECVPVLPARICMLSNR